MIVWLFDSILVKSRKHKRRVQLNIFSIRLGFWHINNQHINYAIDYKTMPELFDAETGTEMLCCRINYDSELI